jgi:hypothetical protein
MVIPGSIAVTVLAQCEWGAFPGFVAARVPAILTYRPVKSDAIVGFVTPRSLLGSG